jgi:capsule polysaccharide export protein KpsE/RkpR
MSADEFEDAARNAEYHRNLIELQAEEIRQQAATIQRLEAELTQLRNQQTLIAQLSVSGVSAEMFAAMTTQLHALNAEIEPLRALFPHGPLHEQVAAVLGERDALRNCHELLVQPYASIEIDIDKVDGLMLVETPSHKTTEVYTKHQFKQALDAAQQAGANSGES